MSSFVKHELKIQINVVKNEKINIKNIETIVENDEDQNIKKFMKKDDQNQNNEKFMKKNEINSRKTD